jgi:chaperonin GroEL
MARREALIVTTARYEDERWNRLRGPGRDGASLGGVLAAPDIGGYSVDYVVDQPTHLIRRRVDAFLARRRTADELLVYFSCHGVKDDDGRLYLVGVDTDYDRDLFESTAVSAAFLNGRLGNCRARSKVLILDCCYSGAFDAQAKGFDSAGIADHMRSAGTAVMTATNELQLAWEEDGLSALDEGAGTASVFTSVLVEGLRTGDAARDAEVLISVGDLFSYAGDVMAERGARQTPKLWLLGSEGSLVIARRVGAKSSDASSRPDGTHRAPAATVPALGPFDRAGDILAGIAAAAEASAVTIGPAARLAVVRNSGGTMLRTADTALAVAALAPATPWAGLGLELVRDLVDRMRVKSLDGAASAVLVLHTLLRGLQPALVEGTRSASLARALGTVTNAAGAALLPFSREVESDADVERVGVTVTGDGRLGRTIAEAMDAIGREGVVKVEEAAADGLDVTLVLQEDLPLACTRLVPATHGRDGDIAETIVLERPFVAVCDLRLSSAGQLERLYDLARAAGRPLAVFVRAAGTEAITALSEPGGRSGIVVVSAEPELLLDVGAWSAASVVRDLETLRHAGPEVLGGAGAMTFMPHRALLCDGKGDVAALSQRIDAIRAAVRQAPSQAERDRESERLAALFGAVAVIRVSELDDAVRGERVRAVRAGIHGCRTAVEAGMVAGAAAALSHAGRTLDAEFRSASPELRAVASAMAGALRAPMLAVASNAGEPRPAHVLEQLAEYWPTSTYDAVSGSFRTAETAGVWDPVSLPLDLLRAVCETARAYLDAL